MDQNLNDKKKRWNFRQWCREKGLKKWFRRDNLIILVLSGVLLFIITMPMEKKGGDADGGGGSQMPGGFVLPRDDSGSTPDQSTVQDTTEEMTDAEYAAWLEMRLTDALSKVEGMGRVQVMITLSASRELVVEREQALSRSATNEADAQGGSRVISQVETGDTVVYSTEGTESVPYVIKTLSPKVEGVLVVAEGAGSGTINRTVTAIVQALFGIEAHKVSVVQMQSK